MLQRENEIDKYSYNKQQSIIKKLKHKYTMTEVAMYTSVQDFFARKKKKQPFMFNANLVDVNSIASTTHV